MSVAAQKDPKIQRLKTYHEPPNRHPFLTQTDYKVHKMDADQLEIMKNKSKLVGKST